MSVSGLDSNLQSLAYDVDPSPVVIESRISAGTDDAEERSSGGMRLTSTDLELVYDGSNQHVGMRFNDLSIPQGAEITNAYIQFQVDETSDDDTFVTFRGEDADHAATFSSSSYDISSRPTTAASVDWAPAEWNDVGEAGSDQRTPNLAPIVQEIIDRGGWSAGNSLVVIATGSGERTAESYNGDSDGAALLHVEYIATSSPPPSGGGSTTVESRVATSTDDAEERDSGSMYLNSSDLEFVYDHGDQKVGMRFNDLAIPQGATVTNAYIQFQADETKSGTTSLTIRGEDTDNASTFTESDRNISSRTSTLASVSWAPDAWTSVGDAGLDERTPNLAAIVQEIVARPGWSANNSMVMMITGSGERVAESYDGDADGAPLLHVEFTTDGDPAPSNELPVANDDTATIAEDGEVTIDVLANDSDPDGDALSVIYIDTAGTKGTVTLHADGMIGYNPAGQFNSLDAGQTAVDKFAYQVTDGNGGTDTAVATVTITGVDGPALPTTATIESRVAASSDDAEERQSGSMYLNSSDLEFVYDHGDQTVGMRFNDLQIPNGATITNAYLQFWADETESGTTSLTIRGEDTDNALTFTKSDRNISSRTLTSASVSWVPEAWTGVGDAGLAQRTPSLAAIVQEIVNRPGWSASNSLVMMINGSGERVADSYDGDSSRAPLLHVEFTTDGEPAPSNELPVANDDTATVAEDGEVTIDVLVNDSDPDGDALSVIYVDTAGTKGSVTLHADGMIGYDPAGQFNSLDAGQTAVDKFAYQVTDGNGGTDTAVATVTITGVDGPALPTTATIESRVAASSDDAEEREDGSMYVNSSDLEFVYDHGDQAVGMRFNDLQIPNGATITNAYLQFWADETESGITSLTIRGEDTDHAATFGSSDWNISSRALTSTSVSWAPEAWTSVGDAGLDQRTPNLAAIVQEIVNRPGWSANNSMVMMINGSGERVADSYDGDSSRAPLLHVEFTTDGSADPVNQAPQVDAGSNRTITFPDNVVLDATVTDDGLPGGSVVTTWTQASGPGSVSFADAGATDTTVTFTETGTYVLRLTADDGQLAASDDVTINVQNTPTSDDELAAFPGAEGFGAQAVGGRGGRVIEVTNLNDSGSGSLRAALEANGPRIVVFRVGGTITLDSRINISDPYLTVAGQTAPGDGITLRNGSSNTKGAFWIETHDVVIRYLRVRPGPGGETDGITLAYDKAYNVVLDHTSISWAVDENLSSWMGVNNVTFQWSIISEGLDDSTHSKGPHSKGILLGSDGSNSFTVHHNLLAHNVERNPRIQADLVDVVNNVIYNPGFHGGWGPSHSTDGYGPIRVNYVGNYYKAGPASGSADYLVSASGDVKIYVEGNITPKRPSDNMDEMVGVVRSSEYGDVVSSRFNTPQVTTTSAFQAYEDVLASAGASMGIDELGNFYLRRDSVDARVVEETRTGTGDIIDDPSEVGGWPKLAAGVAPADSDHDGMPDAWELLWGFDPKSASNGPQDADGDGYTNVEEYLNGTMPMPLSAMTYSSTVMTDSDESATMDVAAADFSLYEEPTTASDDTVMQPSAVDLALAYGDEDSATTDSSATSGTVSSDDSTGSLLSETTELIDELGTTSTTDSEQADLVDLALESDDLTDDSLSIVESELDVLVSLL